MLESATTRRGVLAVFRQTESGSAVEQEALWKPATFAACGTPIGATALAGSGARFDDEAVVLGVGLQDQFLAGVPAPGPDGLDGEGEGVALAAGDREEGAGVAFGGFSAGHRESIGS
jgi:hypothetical protein